MCNASRPRLNTRFTPDDSGDYQFGLIGAGLDRLFVNGTLLVDNWDGWVAGDSYFGDGSREAIGTAQLQAGETYDLAVEYSGQTAGPLWAARPPRGCHAGPLGDAAIERPCSWRRRPMSPFFLLFVGLNGEWDTEGQDRPHIDLVGRQNELVERVAAANPTPSWCYKLGDRSRCRG